MLVLLVLVISIKTEQIVDIGPYWLMGLRRKWANMTIAKKKRWFTIKMFNVKIHHSFSHLKFPASEIDPVLWPIWSNGDLDIVLTQSQYKAISVLLMWAQATDLRFVYWNLLLQEANPPEATNWLWLVMATSHETSGESVPTGGAFVRIR